MLSALKSFWRTPGHRASLDIEPGNDDNNDDFVFHEVDGFQETTA